MNERERNRGKERRLARHGRFSHVAWLRHNASLPSSQRTVIMHFELSRTAEIGWDTVYALHHMRREKSL